MSEPDIDHVWSATAKVNTGQNIELTMPTMLRIRVPSKKTAVQLQPIDSFRIGLV